MKKLVLLSLLLSGCSCAERKDYIGSLPGIPVELDPTLQLSLPNGGVGHACAVDGEVVTARHVMVGEHGNLNAAWSDAYGNEGIATVRISANHLDVSILDVYPEGVVMFLPKSTAKVGETVYWFEYDFRTRKNALRARRRFATILRIVAQQIVLSEVPTRGASGTCLINSNGEVVGIVNAAWYTDDEAGAGNAVKLPPFPEE